MESKNKWLLGSAVAFFYFGDLITTYFALKAGLHETNDIFAAMGFYGTIILKTIFILIIYFSVKNLEKINKSTEIGVVLGAVIAVGLIAMLTNLGFYS